MSGGTSGSDPSDHWWNDVGRTLRGVYEDRNMDIVTGLRETYGWTVRVERKEDFQPKTPGRLHIFKTGSKCGRLYRIERDVRRVIGTERTQGLLAKDK